MTAPGTISIGDRPVTSGYGRFLMQLLSDRERFFLEVLEGEHLSSKLRSAFWTLVVFLGLYGALPALMRVRCRRSPPRSSCPSFSWGPWPSVFRGSS